MHLSMWGVASWLERCKCSYRLRFDRYVTRSKHCHVFVNHSLGSWKPSSDQCVGGDDVTFVCLSGCLAVCLPVVPCYWLGSGWWLTFTPIVNSHYNLAPALTFADFTFLSDSNHYRGTGIVRWPLMTK